MKLQDVLHFYIGGKIYHIITGESYHFIGFELPNTIFAFGKGGRIVLGISVVKPILRPLSSMTEEHRKELFKIVFKREFPSNGGTVFIKERTTLQEPRWVLSSGIDRLGIQFNGEIWADCDLHNYKHNPHLLTLKLCEWGYDLFGLIESGQALNANHPQ